VGVSAFQEINLTDPNSIEKFLPCVGEDPAQFVPIPYLKQAGKVHPRLTSSGADNEIKEGVISSIANVHDAVSWICYLSSHY
jgi:hypothetical protein